MMKTLSACSFLICFAFFTVTAQADYGMFMVVKGDVKVQRADNQISPAKVGLRVAVGDTIISAIDSRAKIVMSDRNVISISPSTKIKIEKYQTGVNKNVELTLTEGKVRNNVEQEYDGEKTKFLIKTPTAVAGVRGTQFVTSYDTKTKITEVVTLKGQVALSNLVSMATVLVNKGEESSMKKDQAPEKPKTTPPETLKSLDHEFSDSKDKSTETKETKKDGQGASDKGKDKEKGIDSKDRQTGGPSAQDGALPPDMHLPPPPPPPPPQNIKNPPTTTKVRVVPTTTGN